MATQKPTVSVPVLEFLAALLRENSSNRRAAIVVSQLEQCFPGSVIAIYRFDEPAQSWTLLASSGEGRPEGLLRRAGALANATELSSPAVWSGARLRLDRYAHLGVSRHVESLACIPLIHGGSLIAAIEVASFDRTIDDRDFAAISDLIGHSAVALATAAAYESERNSNYDSITRLTQLYDLERTFNSTLDMDKLLNIVPAKIREILPCVAINLWMVQDDDLLLAGRSGSDPSTKLGDIQKTGEGLAATVADTGKAAAILNPNDPRLQARAGVAGVPMRSILAVPIIAQGFLVGVVEAIDRDDGQRFTDDDLFFLSTISQTTASALHNASLLEAERKVEILETLVEVSREITSTLNLDRVLQVVVNAPQHIVTYDRAAIALQAKGELRVRAISGKTEVVEQEPSVRLLREMLDFCAISDSEMFIVQRGDQVIADREETRAKFAAYFKSSGSRAWYSIPLQDDEGRLGILSFESRNPEFLTDTHAELIMVLASQATVALRNATLYTDVPFIGVLEPLLQKKAAFLNMEKRRRMAIVAAAVAVVLFLIVVPLPMRVEGTAVVAPLRHAQVQLPFDGVVQRVLVREGDPVQRGTVLAQLDDWEARASLANARAKYEAATAEMNHALAANDGERAGMQRVQADYWASEVSRAGDRLERSRLRSPIAGVVSTPHVEDFEGRKLDEGTTFAEVVDVSQTQVDVAVDQDDLPLLSAGETASVKLEAYPDRKFHGAVAIVSPVASTVGDARVFMARVDVPNRDGLIRAGMQGHGKVFTGWRPAGYVMFRGLGMWVWTKLWTWFGW